MFVYYTLSRVFPDRKTFIGEAVLPDTHDSSATNAIDEESASWDECEIDDKKGGVVVEEIRVES